MAAAKAERPRRGPPDPGTVLEVLDDGSVGRELAQLLGVEVSHLSQQLAILRRAQVVSTRRVRSTVYYSVRDRRMYSCSASPGRC